MTQTREAELFQKARDANFRRTDRLFARLAIVQYFFCLILAVWVTPHTYVGIRQGLHVHLFAAIFLGALITVPVGYCAWRFPGTAFTRYMTASCQVLMSALLIHLSGGRIETHFHVFGSLAFLSFYRDWRVFVPATVIVALDHMVRGIFYPESVFGVFAASNWRWIEHAAWVLFCDYFLIRSVIQQRQEMWETASNHATLERTSEIVEQQVATRTAELRAERKRFEDAFRYAPIGMALVDPDRARLMKVNDELAEILGYPIEQLLDQNLSTFTESGETAKEVIAIQNLEPDFESETEYLRRDGSEARVLLKGSLQFASGAEGRDSYIVQILDLTERFEAEKKLRAQQELLQRSQKMESLGVLAGGIAHELNSPIQFIGDNLGFLREAFEDMEHLLAPLSEPSDSLEIDELRVKAHEVDLKELLCEVPGALVETLDGVKRVSNIVRSMRDYSHPGGEVEEVNLNEILQTATTVARNEWKYVATTSLELAPDLRTVQGSRGELIQAFLNIIINAAHAIQDRDSEQQGCITITTRNLKEEVEIEICDTGTGIPDEIVARIFDPFFTTKPVGRGTGQGLAITSTIVSNHSGSLVVESKRGEGSCFRFRFPAGDSQALAT